MKLSKCKAVLTPLAAVVLLTGLAACKSSALIGPADQTQEAGEVIKLANAELKKIKILYEDNENKREEIKQAMAPPGDTATVQRLSDEIVYLINDGAALAKSALDKIDEARDMNINEDYAEYLRLKSEALNKQMEAFEEYRQAARELRNKYDPKNDQVRSAVEAQFKQRSENYQRLMEQARDRSTEANELAKAVRQQKTEQ
jgi:hypothetical protein